MLVSKNDLLSTVGKKIKAVRKAKKYTQDYVAENIGISTDLLRNIENGRNLGSLTTIINICNILEISPNELFNGLIHFKTTSVDDYLTEYFKSLSKRDRETLKKIIIHLDKTY